MGLIFNRRKKIGKGLNLNIGKKGVSVSKKIGPASISSRGNASFRIGKGARVRKKLF